MSAELADLPGVRAAGQRPGGPAPRVTPKAGLHGLVGVMSCEPVPAAFSLRSHGRLHFGRQATGRGIIQQACDAAAIQRVTQAREAAELTVFLCPVRDTSITGEAVSADGRFFTPFNGQRGTA
jgi:hypothetical protein